jgi:hypothetical protein
MKDAVYLLLPISTLLGWAIYGYWVTGNPFMLLSARSHWETEDTRALKVGLSQLLRGEADALSTLRPYLRVTLAGVAFMAFILFLSYRAWRLDKALGLYNFSSIMAITYFGMPTSYISFPRFLAFLFPVGLGLNLKRRFLLLTAVAVFFALSYVAWLTFLRGFFH